MEKNKKYFNKNNIARKICWKKLDFYGIKDNFEVAINRMK